MRLADHVTLNFNNNVLTAAVFLNFKKAFYTTWHSGLLCKLSQLAFLTSLVKLIASFLTDKNKVLVEGEFSASRNIVAKVSQGSVLAPALYSLYIHASVAPGIHLALFSDNAYIYATEKNEHPVLCRLQ
jgi:hypothetical protein